jgi:hypothetical protein
MDEKRLLAFGVLSAVAILAIIGIVHAMEAPVDQVGQAVASTLRSRPADVDFTIERPWGLPRWVLIIDNAIGALLLAIMFLGGLPLAVVALGLRLFSRPLARRRTVLGRLAPYCLVFQVASLFLASAITAVALVVGGVEPFLESWTWYHVATVVASIVAIPVWRQRIQATTSLPTIFNEPPA